jgi:hypothetical protein
MRLPAAKEALIGVIGRFGVEMFFRSSRSADVDRVGDGTA